MICEIRNRAEFVERNVEEPLYLTSVEFEGEHAVCSRRFDEICHQAGRDGHAWLVLLVTASVCVVGNNRGDPTRRCALGGVDHYQELHDVVVDGEGDGLNEEDILLANVL